MWAHEPWYQGSGKFVQTSWYLVQYCVKEIRIFPTFTPRPDTTFFNYVQEYASKNLCYKQQYDTDINISKLIGLYQELKLAET